MNQGLLYLIAKIPTLVGRRLRRQVRGVRALLLLLVLVLVIGPQAYQAWVAGGPDRGAIDAIRTWAPISFMLTVLLSLSSGAGFTFRPQEVDFLFPAPVARREILLYKVITTLAGGLLAALWVVLFLFRHAPHWPFGILALVLAMWFVQLVGLLAGVAAAAADVRLTRWLRTTLWAALALAAGVGLAVMRYVMPRDAAMRDAVAELVGTWPVRAAAFPGRIFTEMFVARTWPDFLLWASLGAGLLFGLFAVLVRLDVAWTEGSVRQSQLAMRRARRTASEGMIGASGGRRTGLRLPMLPRLLGFGPFVWRQGTEALRNLRSVLVTLVTFVGVPAVIVLLVGRGHGSSTMGAIAPFLGITMLSPHIFAFDFRRDLDRMAMLKALPVSPILVAAGQVAVPAVLRTLLQACVLTGVVLATGELTRAWLGAVLLPLLPVNWMAGALDNAVFLLWPHRVVPKGGEAMLGHRALFGSLLKLAVLLPVIGACAVAGAWTYSLTAAPVVAGATVAVLCAVFALLFTQWLAHRFRRFDVGAFAND